LVGAAQRYFKGTGRRVTFEVVLLAGVNDRPADADAMVHKLKGLPHQVNLLPWNPVEQIADLRRPSSRRVDAFVARLLAGGLNATVRKQRGADRSAACGQLRIST
jgi:23S rRNA (adenine2503-C2)-methyltransferase